MRLICPFLANHTQESSPDVKYMKDKMPFSVAIAPKQ
jgi:hypothetical protein